MLGTIRLYQSVCVCVWSGWGGVGVGCLCFLSQNICFSFEAQRIFIRSLKCFQNIFFLLTHFFNQNCWQKLPPPLQVKLTVPYDLKNSGWGKCWYFPFDHFIKRNIRRRSERPALFSILVTHPSSRERKSPEINLAALRCTSSSFRMTSWIKGSNMLFLKNIYSLSHITIFK